MLNARFDVSGAISAISFHTNFDSTSNGEILAAISLNITISEYFSASTLS